MKRRLLTALLMMVVLLSFSLRPIHAEDDSLVVRNFSTTLDVQEDGSVRITNTLLVDFLTPHHGIYALIPQSYTMDFKDLDRSHYFLPVSDISVDAYPYDSSSTLEGVTLKIGDADTYLTGEHTFTYRYTMQMRDLGRADQTQLFYLNLVGDQWLMDIDQVNFTINMPKDFDTSELSFYVPKDGTTSDLRYTVSGTTITGQYAQTMRTNRGSLTVYLPLPAGYFSFPQNSEIASYAAAVIFALFAMLSLWLFFRFGKDEPLITTVEFSAPEGLSSAQVGYVYRGMTSNKEITSLIFYWASKGYLTIHEVSKDKYELKKVKEMGKEMYSGEQALFNALFKKDSTVRTDKLPQSYQTVLQNSYLTLNQYFKGKRRMYDAFATTLKVLLSLGISFLFSLYVAILLYGYYQTLWVAVVSFLAAFAYAGVALVVLSLIVHFRVDRADPSKRSGAIIFFTMVLAVMVMITLTIAWIMVPWLYGNRMLALIVVGLFYLVAYVLSFMSKLTPYGTHIKGQVLGLRNFIETAEKDRLEALVKDNPEYFYDVLPFAYVLDVTDVWIDKFKNIAMVQPQWYSGDTVYTNNWLFYHSLSRSMSSIHASTAAAAIPQAKGGHGGGFSGGGGGFSGGGFGGGGGGGW